VAGVRQGETATVPEHVRVDRKRHAGALAEPGDQCVEDLGRHRATALGRERVRARRFLALQTAQGTALVTLYWMDAWCASLTSADMQAPGNELDLVPLQIADFGGPKTMPLRDQDHGRIAMTILARLAGAAIKVSISAAVRFV
jgi:hypothetical protein